jgi:hypothetical protein
MAIMTVETRRTFASQFADAVQEATPYRPRLSFSEFETRIRTLEKEFLETATGDADATLMVSRRIAHVLLLEATHERHRLPFETCLQYFHRRLELGFLNRHYECQAAQLFAGYCLSVHRYEEGIRILESLLAGPTLARHEMRDVQHALTQLRSAVAE